MSAPARLLPAARATPVHRAEDLPPPLKWAGGKRWMVPRLVRLYAPHRRRRLVEPFCGGLAVTLGLSPERALLSDANAHLINFYRQVRRGLRVEVELRNDERLYYRHRDRFNALISQGAARGAEAAALFYYLNRTGFNGLCRFNAGGFYNVPFGQYASINYQPDFLHYRPLFRRWSFAAGDFSSLSLDREDFVFADPPYDVEFTSYSAGGFSWDDQVRAAEWLASHAGPVVATNQATRRVVELYRRCGFKLRYLDAPRRISCTGNRTPAREVLATKGM
jgi:DNA adenine methylase